MAGAGLSLAAPVAQAQSTGAVFGPVVKESHAAAEYRAGYDPDSEGFAQRIHFEQSLNIAVNLRGIVQARKTDQSDTDFDYVKGEAYWQITPDGQAWQTGLQFNAVVRDDDRPNSVGALWMNQWKLSGGWQARGVLVTSVDVGDNARDGVHLGS